MRQGIVFDDGRGTLSAGCGHAAEGKRGGKQSDMYCLRMGEAQAVLLYPGQFSTGIGSYEKHAKQRSIRKKAERA